MQWYNPYTVYCFSSVESLLFWLLHFSHGRVFLGGGGVSKQKEDISFTENSYGYAYVSFFKKYILIIRLLKRYILLHMIYLIRENNH